MARKISQRPDAAIIVSREPVAHAKHFTMKLDEAMTAAGKYGRDVATALGIRPQRFSSSFLKREPFVVYLDELDAICECLGVERSFFLD